MLDTSGGTDLYVCVYAAESVTVTIDSSHAMVVDSSITDFTYQPYRGIMVGRCGKNLAYQVVKGYPRMANNILTVDNASETILFNCEQGKTYHISSASTFDRNTICKVSDSTTHVYVGASIPVTNIANNTVYTWTATFTGVCGWYVKSTADELVETTVQVELGTEATEYEPFIGTSYPYSLGQSVYGGTVDLATGVLTVTHKYVEYDGSNDEAWEKYNGGSAGAYAMRVSEADILQRLTATVCTANYLPSVTGGDTWGNYNAFVSGSYSPYVYTGINTITTLEAWKTYLASNPLQVVYLLATPTTVQLTPTEVKTLLGYNNISSTGTVEVIYHADTKLYVDKMTNVDNAIIAPTEEAFTATRNYTVNDLLIVNDTLYKVTANIASGSAITPNSNVQQTTLGALIKALS